MISERVSPDEVQHRAGRRACARPAAPPAVRKPRFERRWLMAGLSFMFVVAAVAVTWWLLTKAATSAA